MKDLAGAVRRHRSCLLALAFTGLAGLPPGLPAQPPGTDAPPPAAALEHSFAVPGTVHTLRALVEHYAALGQYRVQWQTTYNPLVDARQYSTSTLPASRNFAEALQQALLLTTRRAAQSAHAPALIGCFDDKTLTVTVADYAGLPHPKTCQLRPVSWWD